MSGKTTLDWNFPVIDIISVIISLISLSIAIYVAHHVSRLSVHIVDEGNLDVEVDVDES